MTNSARVLLEGIFDYAGTFPPAGLTLAQAAANYSRDRASADAWMLGRLIVSANALVEGVQAFRPADKWPLSVVLGPQRGSLDEALTSINSLNVLSVEFSPLKADEIRAVKQRVPPSVELFFETPLDADFDKRIDAIADAKAMAKIRTGGVSSGAFPGTQDLVRFMTACDDAGLAFKATAGLHHAVRGSYPLTNEAGSATAAMHGFLNVAIAAALVRAGADPSEATDALCEESPQAFQFGESGILWRDRTIMVDELSECRHLFFKSFGSCAFREPVDELKGLKLI